MGRSLALWRGIGRRRRDCAGRQQLPPIAGLWGRAEGRLGCVGRGRPGRAEARQGSCRRWERVSGTGRGGSTPFPAVLEFDSGRSQSGRRRAFVPCCSARGVPAAGSPARPGPRGRALCFCRGYRRTSALATVSGGRCHGRARSWPCPPRYRHRQRSGGRGAALGAVTGPHGSERLSPARLMRPPLTCNPQGRGGLGLPQLWLQLPRGTGRAGAPLPYGPGALGAPPPPPPARLRGGRGDSGTLRAL